MKPRWANLTAVYANETTIAFVAMAFIVAQAPVFQNVGGNGRPAIERVSVACFYISFFLAALSYFLGQIVFHLKCPSLIRAHPRVESYVDGLRANSNEAFVVQAGLGRVAEWTNANRTPVSAVLFVVTIGFGVFLVTAYGLGILSLVLFATR